MLRRRGKRNQKKAVGAVASQQLVVVWGPRHAFSRGVGKFAKKRNWCLFSTAARPVIVIVIVIVSLSTRNLVVVIVVVAHSPGTSHAHGTSQSGQHMGQQSRPAAIDHAIDVSEGGAP